MSTESLPPRVAAEAQRILDSEARRILDERCQWFALCENPAVTTRPHPILGDVPICARCNDRVDELAK